MRTIGFAVVALMALCTAPWSPVHAAWYDGLPNELVNGKFTATPPTQGWIVSGPDVTVYDYIDAPSNGPGAGVRDAGSGSIYQIVDELPYLRPGNQKRVRLDFKYRCQTQGTHGITATVSYWPGYSGNNVPNTSAAVTFQSIQCRPDDGVGGPSSSWIEGTIATEQPRWIMVSFTFTGTNNPVSPKDWLWVGDVVLRAQCVPEPSSLIALGAGLTGLIGLAHRKQTA